MCELACLVIPHVPKSHRLSEGGDRSLVTGQKMPAALCSWPLVAIDVDFLLGGSDLGCLARIEADCEHVKLFPGVKLEHAQRAGGSIEYLVAQHGAIKVNQGQNHRSSLMEVFGQAYFPTGLISK